MTLPIRIQLKRERGWRMPPNTVKVDRSTCWGNPYRVGHEAPSGLVIPDAESAVGFFTAMLEDTQHRAATGYPADLTPLRGKNLACWCKPSNWCHAEVLLQRANAHEVTMRERGWYCLDRPGTRVAHRVEFSSDGLWGFAWCDLWMHRSNRLVLASDRHKHCAHCQRLANRETQP